MRSFNALGAVVATLWLATGCLGSSPETMPADVCDVDLPPTYSIAEAVVEAEEILLACPDRQEQVFHALLDVGKANPGVRNRTEILSLYNRLIRADAVNANEARQLMTQYFYTRFAAVDQVNDRFSGLSDLALDRMAQSIQSELEMKKVGLSEVADSPQQYERAASLAGRMQGILESTKIQWQYLRRQQGE